MANDFFRTLIRSRGELSTRTTFMLCDKANSAIQWMIHEAGVHLRDVIDGMVREFEKDHSRSSCIQEIVTALTSEDVPCPDLTVRKTITLGKESLDLLNALSKKYSLNRDLLLNRIIMHSHNCLKEAIEEENARRIKVIEKIDDWAQKGLENSDEYDILLSEDRELKTRLINDLNDLQKIIDKAKQSSTASSPIPSKAV